MRSALRALALFVLSLPLLADPRLVRSEKICSACSVAAADVNGDGLDDLLDGDEVLFNLGGRFDVRLKMAGYTTSDAMYRLGDFNGDGRADAFVAGPMNGWMPGTTLRYGLDRLLAGDGTGRFIRVSYPYASLGRVEKIADFDGDGKLDAVAVGGDAFHLLRGNGDATFTLAQTIRSASPADLAFGDLDRDGHPDLVFATGPFLHFCSGQGGGLFVEGRTRFVGVTPSKLDLVDVNGDGRLDVVMDESFTTSGLTALFGDGNGGFPAMSRILVDDNRENASVAGDFFAGGGLEVARAASDGVKVYSAVGNEWRIIATFEAENATGYTILGGNFDADAQDELLTRARPGSRSETFLLDGEGFAQSARARAIRRGDPPVEKIAGDWNVDVSATCVLPPIDTWSFTREGMFVTLTGVDAQAAYVPGDEVLVLWVTLPDGVQSRTLRGSLLLADDEMRGALFEAEPLCGYANGQFQFVLTRKR